VIRLPERPGTAAKQPPQPSEQTEQSEPTGATASASSPLAFQYQQGAVVVTKAADGSAEYAAGLREGDALVAIGGEPVYSAAQAQGMLKLNAGSGVVIEIRRSGQLIKIKLARRHQSALPR
jgi:C-terminal processing protease CtpA/Prc